MTGDGTSTTEDTIRFLVAQVQELRERVGTLERELRSVKEAQLDEAEEREREMAAVDDSGRKNSLVFHGLDWDPQSSASSTAAKFLESAGITGQPIIDARHLPNSKKTIVRLASAVNKPEILQAVKAKNSGVTAKPDLCPRTRKDRGILFPLLLNLKKNRTGNTAAPRLFNASIISGNDSYTVHSRRGCYEKRTAGKHAAFLPIPVPEPEPVSSQITATATTATPQPTSAVRGGDPQPSTSAVKGGDKRPLEPTPPEQEGPACPPPKRTTRSPRDRVRGSILNHSNVRALRSRK